MMSSSGLFHPLFHFTFCKCSKGYVASCLCSETGAVQLKEGLSGLPLGCKWDFDASVPV